MTLQKDGTYTTTVLYTVTEKDCEGGYVNLSVTAETDYEYLLSLSDIVGNRSDVVTKTTITANGDARCNIVQQVLLHILQIILVQKESIQEISGCNNYSGIR